MNARTMTRMMGAAVTAARLKKGMISMLNNVSLQGRLVADPELRTTETGISSVMFAVACERSFAGANGNRECDFIDCVAWRNTADFICKWFRKGSPILVQGSVRTRTYEDRNGNRRKSTAVHVDQVHFAGGRAQDNTQTAASAPAPAAERTGSYVPAGDDFTVLDDEGDLPF